MATAHGFPSQREGRLFLTEGGLETEIMYKWGFELPHFAAYPLLENAAAVEALRGVFRRYLRVAADHGMGALMGGLDYRASPDWGKLLGYSPEGLADANVRSIDFLRELAREFERDIPEILFVGYVGPRGDAYALNRDITEAQAEEYHSVQLRTLARAGVDLAVAATFNNVPEAVGVTRAAASIGVPLAVFLTLDGSGKLRSGPTLSEAVTAIDAQTDRGPAFYGLNCSHPVEYEPALLEGDGDWMGRMRCFRPNASRMEKIALCKLGHLEEGDPVELGQQLGDLARRYPHLDLWGGCCGTGDVHLREIADNVVAARRQG